MIGTGMAVKKKTISMASTARKPVDRSSPGWYKLHNDTNGQVSVFRQEWDVPKQLFDLAPGATSDQYEAGHEIYILFSASGESPIVDFDSQDQYSVYYHVSGYTTGNEVNNVSSF
ncbi:hypothetical protein [Nocardia abscessus]|uniref:hypothetical protein n=1 Tax=Nocardia abscessus TaxID=120957 RepID=UPI00030AE5FA|nr:hypothetical protein [Nocardia abscessus]MCC3326112.1 hypothetical protein [Nocardia abscessus]